MPEERTHHFAVGGRSKHTRGKVSRSKSSDLIREPRRQLLPKSKSQTRFPRLTPARPESGRSSNGKKSIMQIGGDDEDDEDDTDEYSDEVHHKSRKHGEETNDSKTASEASRQHTESSAKPESVTQSGQDMLGNSDSQSDLSKQTVQSQEAPSPKAVEGLFVNSSANVPCPAPESFSESDQISQEQIEVVEDSIQPSQTRPNEDYSPKSLRSPNMQNRQSSQAGQTINVGAALDSSKVKKPQTENSTRWDSGSSRQQGQNRTASDNGSLLHSGIETGTNNEKSPSPSPRPKSTKSSSPETSRKTQPRFQAFQPLAPTAAPPQISADFVMALADNSPVALAVENEAKFKNNRGPSWADLTANYDTSNSNLLSGVHNSDSNELINRPKSRSSMHSKDTDKGSSAGDLRSSSPSTSGESYFQAHQSLNPSSAAPNGTTTRTQQKLWLCKQGMDLVSQTQSHEKRECDRLAREYAYTRRFGSAIADSLARIKRGQKNAGLKPASRVTAPAHQYSLSATSMYYKEESSEPLMGVLNKMWNERTWRDPDEVAAATEAGTNASAEDPNSTSQTNIHTAAQQVQQQMLAAQRRQGLRIT